MKRWVASSFAWAVVCFAIALPWTITGRAVDFVPFVCLLIAGFLCGISVLRALSRAKSQRAAFWLHLELAIAFVVLGVLLVPRLSEISEQLLTVLPEAVVSLLWACFMMSITGVGIIWLGLLSRVTAMVTSRSGPDPEPPQWESVGPGARIAFTAVVMTRSAYLVLVSCAGLVGAAVCVSVFVLAEPIVGRWGPKLLLLVFGICIGVPIYFAVRGVLRSRSRACTVTFARGRIIVTAGERRIDNALGDLDALVWHESGEAARIELRSGATELTLLVGVARQARGVRAALPPLSRRVRAELAEAGLPDPISSSGSRSDGRRGTA